MCSTIHVIDVLPNESWATRPFDAACHGNKSPRRKPGDSGCDHHPTCHADPRTPNVPVPPGFRPGLLVKRTCGWIHPSCATRPLCFRISKSAAGRRPSRRSRETGGRSPTPVRAAWRDRQRLLRAMERRSCQKHTGVHVEGQTPDWRQKGGAFPTGSRSGNRFRSPFPEATIRTMPHVRTSR